MTSPEVSVKNAGPADVIAYVWYQLGYPPQNSLVLAGVRGRDRRLGMIARADLPPSHASQRLIRELVRSLAGPLARDGASQVMVLVCAPDALAPPGVLLRALHTELSRLGLSALEVLGVTGTAYRSLLCGDPACCPGHGHDVSHVLATRTAASLVLAGYPLRGCEDDLLDDVRPEVAPGGPPVGPGNPARPLEPLGWLEPLDQRERELWWRRWRAAITGDGGDGVIQEWWAVLHDPALRDAVMLSALGAPVHTCEQMIGEPRATEMLLPAALDQAPDPARLRAAEQLLTPSARRAPAGRRAPVLAVLAVLAWFGGRGPRARLLTSHALDDDPGYSLAVLVQELLVHAVPPPWAQAEFSGPDG